jgi:hypothetical protein
MIAAAGMERFTRITSPEQEFDVPASARCNILPGSTENDRACCVSLGGGVHVPAKSTAGIHRAMEPLVEGAIQ